MLTSSYDKRQRLVTLSEKLPTEATPRQTYYYYFANGNVAGKNHANGTAQSTSYDASAGIAGRKESARISP